MVLIDDSLAHCFLTSSEASRPLAAKPGEPALASPSLPSGFDAGATPPPDPNCPALPGCPRGCFDSCQSSPASLSSCFWYCEDFSGSDTLYFLTSSANLITSACWRAGIARKRDISDEEIWPGARSLVVVLYQRACGASFKVLPAPPRLNARSIARSSSFVTFSGFS